MKNKSKFALEIIITLIVATLLSSTIAVILAFIAGNLGAKTHSLVWVNTVASIAWGLFIGYKLSTLIREHRK
ncbi:MAG: hypothetical protein ABWX90_02440 [Candidatus Saccharimonadales bacterium]